MKTSTSASTSFFALLLAASTSAYPSWFSSLHHSSHRLPDLLSSKSIPSPLNHLHDFIENELSLSQRPLIPTTQDHRHSPPAASPYLPSEITLASSTESQGQNWLTGTIHMHSPISPLTSSPPTTVPLRFSIASQSCEVLQSENRSCLITDLANAFVNDLPTGLTLVGEEESVGVVEDIWEVLGGREVHGSEEIRMWGAGRLDARAWVDLVGVLRSAVMEVEREVVERELVDGEGRRDVKMEGVVDGVRVEAEWRWSVFERETGLWAGCAKTMAREDL